MNLKAKNAFLLSGILFVLFAILTVSLCLFDRQPIGPQNSEVGLATLNGFVFNTLGESKFWYDVTELLGMVVLLTAGCFGILGVYQLIRRKSLKRVDADLYLLAICYIAVIALYVLFELVVINCRPVLEEGVLEASYPSSHTMLAVFIMSTAVMQILRRVNLKWLRIALVILSLLILLIVVIGRLLAGVHWFTDILAGAILSGALAVFYFAVCKRFLWID